MLYPCTFISCAELVVQQLNTLPRWRATYRLCGPSLSHFLLFNVASAREVPFGILQYTQGILNRLTNVLSSKWTVVRFHLTTVHLLLSTTLANSILYTSQYHFHPQIIIR